MRDGYTVLEGPPPQVIVTTRGGLVHTYRTTAEVDALDPGRWPGLRAAWRAARPRDLVTTPAALAAALPRKDA